MSINIIAVVASTIGGFILSTIWYTIFGKARADLLGLDPKQQERPKPSVAVLELARTFILALVFAIILSQSQDSSLHASILLGLRLWLAFPLVLLSGSVMWDKVPKKLAAIHAGDWIIKLMLIAILVGAWR